MLFISLFVFTLPFQASSPHYPPSSTLLSSPHLLGPLRASASFPSQTLREEKRSHKCQKLPRSPDTTPQSSRALLRNHGSCQVSGLKGKKILCKYTYQTIRNFQCRFQIICSPEKRQTTLHWHPSSAASWQVYEATVNLHGLICEMGTSEAVLQGPDDSR